MAIAPVTHAETDVATELSTGSSTVAKDTSTANLIVLAVQSLAGSSYTVSGKIGASDDGNTYIGSTILSATGAASQLQLFRCVGANVGANHKFTVSGTGIYAGIEMYAFKGVGKLRPDE